MGGQAAILQMGQATLEIFDEAQAAAIDLLEAGRRVSGPVRFALQVPDLQTALDRLLSKGATLVHPPVVTPWGDRNARVQDPDGLQVTLLPVLDPATHPTPYPEVNAVLAALLAGVRSILGDQLFGVYLYGSLAGGDFDPRTSDLDFVVVSADDLPAEMVPALAALHARLAASGLKWAAKLEGSYLSRRALRRYQPGEPACPQINEGRFYMAPHGSDWIIQRHILREHGVVVVGPSAATLIDPLQPDELRQAVRGILKEWWAPMLADPAALQRPGYQAYAVLSMCRALYTLQYGAVASKPASGRWAQATLGEPWAPLIARALTWPAEGIPDDLAEILDFIRYTCKKA